MKLTYLLIIMSLFGLTVANAAEAPKSEKKAEAAAKMPAYYMCPKCHVLSETAGKCPKCGEAMTPTHILAVKKGMAYCCGCGEGCKCTAMDKKMTKCSCGKDIMKVDVKGMYVCPGDKKMGQCPYVSEKPGKCPMCGKELKEAK